MREIVRPGMELRVEKDEEVVGGMMEVWAGRRSFGGMMRISPVEWSRIYTLAVIVICEVFRRLTKER